MRVFGVCAALVLAASTAQADRLTEPPPIPERQSTMNRAMDNLSWMSFDLGNHLRNVSFNLMDVRLDVKHRRGRFRLGGGKTSQLRFEVSGDFVVEKSAARVTPELRVAMAGKELILPLPKLDVQPTSAYGESGVMLTVPFLYGSF